MKKIKKQLTKNEEEILFSDFPDKLIVLDRETINMYSRNTRGSVRLATGRFYTNDEMKKRAEKAFSVKF